MASLYPSPFSNSTNVAACNGTIDIPFSPQLEVDAGQDGFNSSIYYQTITMQQAYQKYSLEELRLADYDRGRRNKDIAGTISSVTPAPVIGISNGNEACSLNWTKSDLFQLSVEGCATRHNIHKDILQKAAPVIAAKGFREDADKHYVFQETDESMIQTLIEWAYTKTYSVPSAPINQNKSKGHNYLIYHASVYVFADTYLIDSLKKLAINKLNGAISHAEFSSNFNERLIELLEFSFGKNLGEADHLLSWLGRYTLSQIHRLRNDPAFQTILPSMALSMLPYLKLDEFAPQCV